MPRPKFHDLKSDVENLRAILSKRRTRDVGRAVASRFFGLYVGDRGELHSPYRQLFFLLDALLATPEPRDPEEFGSEEMNRCLGLVDSAFRYYLDAFFFPPEGEAQSARDDWLEDVAVAMPAFLDYFFSGPLKTHDQTSRRILDSFRPFSGWMKENHGADLDEFVCAIEWIGERVQRAVDEMQALGEEEETHRHRILDEAEKHGWGVDQIREASIREGHAEKIREFLDSMAAPFELGQQELVDEVGQRVCEALVDALGTCRADRPVSYPTDVGDVNTKPIIVLDDGVLMIPCYPALFATFDAVMSNALGRDSTLSARFFKHRDDALEAEVEQVLRRMIPDATYHRSAFLRSDAQNEQDLIVRDGRVLLAIEAKASPPREPLRDPDRAAHRIRSDFGGKKGVQKGHEQAERLLGALRGGKLVPLYNEKGSEIDCLDPRDFDQFYAIVVTRDRWGMLATDLSLLLKKDPDVPYPWAISIQDLDSIVTAFLFKGLSRRDLYRYICDRGRLHGRVMSTDELNFAGHFLKTGDLMELDHGEGTRNQLQEDMSAIFDEIDHALHGGPPVDWVAWEQPPVMMDVKDIIREAMATAPAAEPEIGGTSRIPKKIGRNELCPCGSGRKYKRCCGP